MQSCTASEQQFLEVFGYHTLAWYPASTPQKALNSAISGSVSLTMLQPPKTGISDIHTHLRLFVGYSLGTTLICGTPKTLENIKKCQKSLTGTHSITKRYGKVKHYENRDFAQNSQFLR